MKVAMLDTMIFDALIADANGLRTVLAAIETGQLLLRTTHIQEEQLRNITDDAKRARIDTIPREIVSTSVAVYGVSQYGMARYGDGKHREEQAQYWSDGEPKAEDLPDLVRPTALEKLGWVSVRQRGSQVEALRSGSAAVAVSVCVHRVVRGGDHAVQFAGEVGELLVEAT